MIAKRSAGGFPETRHSAIAAEIDRYRDDRPVLAYRETVVERLARWISRHRFIVLLVLAYILMRVILIFAAGH